MSADFQTVAASATRTAPADLYSASVKPALRPADFWMSTLAPRDTHRRQRLGVIDTLVSPIFISRGTPIFMDRSCDRAPGRQVATNRRPELGKRRCLRHGLGGYAEDAQPHGGLR